MPRLLYFEVTSMNIIKLLKEQSLQTILYPLTKKIMSHPLLKRVALFICINGSIPANRWLSNCELLALFRRNIHLQYFLPKMKRCPIMDTKFYLFLVCLCQTKTKNSWITIGIKHNPIVINHSIPDSQLVLNIELIPGTITTIICNTIPKAKAKAIIQFLSLKIWMKECLTSLIPIICISSENARVTKAIVLAWPRMPGFPS